jgi:transcriptional regulator with XRE-family HTH domain
MGNTQVLDRPQVGLTAREALCRFATVSVEIAEESADFDEVGHQLRVLRQRRRLTLKVVAEQAGVSESFLSQLERGRSRPSIATLQRIARALGSTMADLFEPDGLTRPVLQKRADRPVLTLPGLRKHLVTPRPLENLEVIFGELDVGGTTGEEAYAHGDSEEVFMVLSGTVEVQVGSSVYRLGPKDSINYRSSSPHLTRNVGDTVAEIIWIISPPSY